MVNAVVARDERYPAQSAVPLTGACASPEMAFGRVWVDYPIVPVVSQLNESATDTKFSAIAATDEPDNMTKSQLDELVIPITPHLCIEETPSVSYPVTVEITAMETQDEGVEHALNETVKTVSAQQPLAASRKHHASAPTTKAPAPRYVPEIPKPGNWQRSAFEFSGKGAAGGHAAINQATVPTGRPQSVK